VLRFDRGAGGVPTAREEAVFGVQGGLRGVQLPPVRAERGRAVGAAQLGRGGGDLGWGEQHGPGLHRGDDGGHGLVALGRGGETVGLQRAGGFGVDVPRRPRRPTSGEGGEDHGGGVDDQLRTRDRSGGERVRVGGEGTLQPLLRVRVEHGGRPLPPFLRELLQRVDLLRFPGGEGGLLPQPDDRRGVGASAVVGLVLLDEPVGLDVDRRRPPGEQLEELLGDGGEFEGRVALRAAFPVLPREAEAGGEVIGEQGVVAFRHRDRGAVQGAGVQGAPPPVRALRPVGDHHVGVQVRVVLAGVPVVERGSDHAVDVDLGGAVGADPGAGDVPLEQG